MIVKFHPGNGATGFAFEPEYVEINQQRTFVSEGIAVVYQPHSDGVKATVEVQGQAIGNFYVSRSGFVTIARHRTDKAHTINSAVQLLLSQYQRSTRARNMAASAFGVIA